MLDYHAILLEMRGLVRDMRTSGLFSEERVAYLQNKLDETENTIREIDRASKVMVEHATPAEE